MRGGEEEEGEVVVVAAAVEDVRVVRVEVPRGDQMQKQSRIPRDERRFSASGAGNPG